MRRPRLSRPDRRDGFLIPIGALALLLGYGYSVTRVPVGVHSSLHTATEYVPLWVYGLGWAVTGVVSIVSAYSRRADVGFAAAVFMPTVWGLAYLIGWFHGDSGRGWLTAAIFWALAWAVFSVAALIDPDPILRRRGER